MKIRFVDSFAIRQFLDPDFGILQTRLTNTLAFSSKWYIPEKEWWCDLRFADEADFLLAVDHARFTLEKTASPSRSRREIMRRFTESGHCPNFVIKYSRHKNLRIAQVDGSIVRRYIDPQFIIGGHDIVYPYIPKNEIWIDAKLDPRDIPHVLVHESLERDLMRKGKSYDVAHDWATAAEKESRRKCGGTYPGDENFPDAYRNMKKFITTVVYAKRNQEKRGAKK